MVVGVTTFDATPRTTVRRLPDRGSYDVDLVHSILDEGLLAHVALNDEAHGPVVLPMTFARIDDRLYLHGALSNRIMRGIADGQPVCITVTLLDALVMSCAAFHHSMNYRCVVVFGQGERVTDRDEMLAASAALVERMEAGRSAKARVPSDAELRKTLIVRVPAGRGERQGAHRAAVRGTRGPGAAGVGRDRAHDPGPGRAGARRRVLRSAGLAVGTDQWWQEQSESWH